jgi:CRISPR type I-E-associated protein CasA/Cse1
LQYAQHKPLPILGEDEPTWEAEKPYKKREKPNGYLDYLTWQNRKVLLVPNENGSVGSMRIMRGLDLGKDIEDPFKLYFKKDDGWKFLPFTKERSLWRDSHTLLRRNDPNNVHPPKSMEWLALILEDTSCLKSNQIYRYMALGAGVHYKDAKIYFYRHENMPLPLSYLTDENLVSKLTEAATYTELVKSSLNRAVFTLAKNFVSPYVDEGGRQPDIEDIKKLMNHWSSETFYWSKLETPFSLFVVELPNDYKSALARWNEILQQTAKEALQSAIRMAGENTKALKAAVRAESVLRGELKKLFESTQPQQEVTA